jgi:hypothetical protein
MAIGQHSEEAIRGGHEPNEGVSFVLEHSDLLDFAVLPERRPNEILCTTTLSLHIMSG